MEKWGWMIALDSLCGDNVILRNAWLEETMISFLNQLSFKKDMAMLKQ